MRRWTLDLSLWIVGIFRDFASRMRIASFVGPTLQVHPSLPKAHFFLSSKSVFVFRIQIMPVRQLALAVFEADTICYS